MGAAGDDSYHLLRVKRFFGQKLPAIFALRKIVKAKITTLFVASLGSPPFQQGVEKCLFSCPLSPFRRSAPDQPAAHENLPCLVFDSTHRSCLRFRAGIARAPVLARPTGRALADGASTPTASASWFLPSEGTSPRRCRPILIQVTRLPAIPSSGRVPVMTWEFCVAPPSRFATTGQGGSRHNFPGKNPAP